MPFLVQTEKPVESENINKWMWAMSCELWAILLLKTDH